MMSLTAALPAIPMPKAAKAVPEATKKCIRFIAYQPARNCGMTSLLKEVYLPELNKTIYSSAPLMELMKGYRNMKVTVKTGKGTDHKACF